MEDELKKNLDEELNREMVEFCVQDPASEGYSAATERVAKLYDLKIKEQIADQEMQLKTEQAKIERRNFWIKTAVDVTAIVLPLGCYCVLASNTFEIERTGTVTSSIYRSLINFFKPKR